MGMTVIAMRITLPFMVSPALLKTVLQTNISSFLSYLLLQVS
jgi:hypothetical protein